LALRRLAKQLDLSPGEVALLAARARRRLGFRRYLVRLVAFVLATAPVLRTAIPANLRLRAIRPFLYALLPGPTENLLYVGAGGYGATEERHG
jgi:hypothetical protein